MIRPAWTLPAASVYLSTKSAASMASALVFTVSGVYLVTVVGLNPLQLVLVGTALEAAVLLFEVPTGVVADVYSRRLSIIIGMFLMGAGFVLWGAMPTFAAALAAQVIWVSGTRSPVERTPRGSVSWRQHLLCARRWWPPVSFSHRPWHCTPARSDVAEKERARWARKSHPTVSDKRHAQGRQTALFVSMTPLEFRTRAERIFGPKVGVIDGDKRFTYAQFGERSRRLASAIRRLGVQPGEVVSFITYNTHHLLEAYYGVLQAGAILNPINIRLNPQEISYILNHAESRAVFFHKDFVPMVSAMRDALPTARAFVVLEPDLALPFSAHEYETLLRDAPPLSSDPAVDENAPAELFYTSGTTGKPKGVILTHRSLYLHALYSTISLRLADDAVLLHIVPMFHVNGWGSPHTITGSGGTHVMLRKIDPLDIFRLIQTERVTIVLGVPTIYNALVNHPEIDRYDLSSLKIALTGGAPASSTLIKAMDERLGCEAMVGYGLTETSPVLTLARPKAHLAGDSPDEQRERRSKTGYQVLGVDIRVVGAEGRDVPADGATVGEIVARSNVVMDGYYKDSQATAEAIRDGWFYTGDMATVDAEGYVLIVDRKKDIIISGGENISSVEVENTLCAHPAVFEVAVIGVPDDQWGEVPKALAVLKPGAKATEQELIEFCRDRLAHFKAPKSVELLEHLPKGGTGKILKGELRERYWAGLAKRVH